MTLTVLGLLLLAGLAFGAIQLATQDDAPAGRRGAGAAASAGAGGGRAGARGGAFDNGRVTVAVLNGTPVSGLAKKFAARLVSAGFRQGPVTNASDQARSATIVSFLPGRRRQAQVVGRTLRVGAVEPIDATTRAIVCSPPARCPDAVVTVGADRAG